MKILISHDRCQGAGQCALNAPALFDQSEDDGTVILRTEQPPPEQHDAARLAAGLCPNAVIGIAEDD
ncbi:ferredoxin [Streptantibioticus cattleyicolor]|uniref:PimF protein n=1 Tax=Streptantibioticus cattleyicolor (strain ATCC 35852 / DSM 46488 / JCM 4925 / NBRC 14057 / NRRL 8057) TaxID=1003195 RepID=F8JNI8_STREN|nr:ferredoxin [Streptantibioticus cattleyicolor]AEW99043.1 PimF protein [Streptantibioticus cattleyicolor NRRL 8057 = DSM 46488]CCB71908.1 Ferredoxin-2 [Streptantibioticus cattleyicolor NRRL 8057 = DSM 46488]